MGTFGFMYMIPIGDKRAVNVSAGAWGMEQLIGGKDFSKELTFELGLEG